MATIPTKKISEITTLLSDLTKETLVAVAEDDGAGGYVTKKVDLRDIDDVKGYTDFASFPGTGKADTLYIDESTNAIYYWDGAAYVSAGGYTDEKAVDAVAAALTGGTNVSITYDDANDIITIDGTDTQLTNEEVQDIVGAFIVGGTNVTVTYDDTGNTLTIDASGTQRTDEEIQDVVNALLIGSGNITLTYDDVNNTLTIDDSHNHDTEYLGINDKAADSDLLDGKDSTRYLNRGSSGTQYSAGANTITFSETSNTSASGAVTIDWRTSNKQQITLSEDTTFSFTDPSEPCNLVLRIIQDATGGWAVTMPALLTPGGTSLSFSTAANAVDLLMLYFDGTNYIATILNDIK